MKNYGEVHEKPIYGGNCLKRWAWAVRFKGDLGKNERVGVFKGGFDTPMHTMNLVTLLYKIRDIKVLRLDICTSMILLSKIAPQSGTITIQPKKQGKLIWIFST